MNVEESSKVAELRKQKIDPKAGKFCIIVMGPESSGGRLIKKVLLKSGCDGDPSNKQKWDVNPPTNQPLVIWHKSVPYGRKWPDLTEWIQSIRKSGYAIKAVVTLRDWFPMTISGKYNHALFFKHEIDRARRALYDIFKTLYEENVVFFPVSYEALVRYPTETFTWLCQELEIPFPEFNFSSIFDGNEKYYKDFENQLNKWKKSAVPPNR